ncbi:hypothetical protein [uncultured Enterovirga sp.]
MNQVAAAVRQAETLARLHPAGRPGLRRLPAKATTGLPPALAAQIEQSH